MDNTKYLITIAMHDNDRGLEFLDRWKQQSSTIPYETQIVIADGDNQELVRAASAIAPTKTRENIGRDYGSYQWSWSRHKDAGFSHFFFLNDDVHFVAEDWLEQTHKGFSLAENVGIVGIQMAINHQGIRIPRGPFWAAKQEALCELDWPPPPNNDVPVPELTLLVPLYEKWAMAQAGSGENLLRDDKSSSWCNPGSCVFGKEK